MSEPKTWSGLTPSQARSVQLTLCQFSKRPAYEKTFGSRNSEVATQHEMICAVIAELWRVTKFHKIACGKRLGLKDKNAVGNIVEKGRWPVPSPISMLSGILQYAVIGDRNPSDPEYAVLEGIARQIYVYFVPNDESDLARLPYFLPHRRCCRSAYDTRELCMTIDWLADFVTQTRANARLAYVISEYDQRILFGGRPKLRERLMKVAKKEPGIEVMLLYPEEASEARIALEQLVHDACHDGAVPQLIRACGIPASLWFHPLLSYLYRASSAETKKFGEESLRLWFIRPYNSQPNQTSAPLTSLATPEELIKFTSWFNKLGV